MINNLLTSTVYILYIICFSYYCLQLTDFYLQLFWLNFEFTGQLHFNLLFCLATNQMKYYFYNAQENLKDLQNIKCTDL